MSKVDPKIPFAPLAPIAAFLTKIDDPPDAKSRKELPVTSAPFQPTQYLKERTARSVRANRKRQKPKVFKPQEVIETFRANAFSGDEDNPFIDVDK